MHKAQYGGSNFKANRANIVSRINLILKLYSNILFLNYSFTVASKGPLTGCIS